MIVTHRTLSAAAAALFLALLATSSVRADIIEQMARDHH